MITQNKYKITLQFEELPKETIKCMTINKDITKLVICVWTKIYIYRIDDTFQIHLLQEIQEGNLLIDLVRFQNYKDFLTAGYEIIFWNYGEIWYEAHKIEFEERIQELIFNQKQNLFVVAFDETFSIYENKNNEWVRVYNYQFACKIYCLSLSLEEKVLIVGTFSKGVVAFCKRNRWQESIQLIKIANTNRIAHISNNSFAILINGRSNLLIYTWNIWMKKQVRAAKLRICQDGAQINLNNNFHLYYLNSFLAIKYQYFLHLVQIVNGNQYKLFEKFSLKSQTQSTCISENLKLIIFWNSRGKGIEFWVLK